MPLGIAKIVEAALNLVRRPSGLKDSWMQWMDISEFYTYVRDVRAVFEHAKGYVQFTGPQAATKLYTLCELLEPLTSQVDEYQRSPVQVVLMVDKKTITDVGEVSPLHPRSIYLREEQHPTIDGLREKPKAANYIEAGAFLSYLKDLERVFNLLYRDGEHFLGSDALNIVGKINTEMVSIISYFDSWRTTQHADKITKLLLEKKDYPTLRKFIT